MTLYESAPFKYMASECWRASRSIPKYVTASRGFEGTEITVESILNLIADGYNTARHTSHCILGWRTSTYDAALGTGLWFIEHPDLGPLMDDE